MLVSVGDDDVVVGLVESCVGWLNDDESVDDVGGVDVSGGVEVDGK